MPAQGPVPDLPTDCGPPEFCICSRRSASALPLLTFRAPASALPLSSTSTQRPPIWLPVLDGTQTMCFFPLFADVLAFDADVGFRSKFSCVRSFVLVFVFMMDAFTAPLTTNVTRYTPAASPSET